MSQPTPYEPTTDFADDEADGVGGRSTVRTTALDTEFDNIATTIGQILANLSAIQRDDGKLQDLLVEPFNLSASTLALLGSAGFTVNNPITWSTGQSYAARSMIKNGTGTYVAVVAHTSAALFATDLAAGKWVVIFDSVNYTAAGVSFTPTGTIAATNVQAAIAEAALEAAQKSANLSDLGSAATARTNLSVFSKAEVQSLASNTAAAGGSVDAITAAFTPTITAYANSQPLIVECAGANATTTPTLNVDGLGTKTIVRPDGSALLVGDIPGANFRAIFVYDLSLDKVLLLNPKHAGPTPGAAGTALVSNGATAQPTFQSLNSTTVNNRAINGCFRIDQINEGAAVTVNSAGPTQALDQWSGFGIGAAGVFTLTRESDPDYTGEFNLKFACTTADASLAATDLYGFHTDLEGYNVADWLMGTAGAKQITVQFEVKCTIVGTFGISVTNSAGNRTYVGEVTINSANTVEQKSVTLTLDQSGTWLQTNGTGMRVRFCMAAGSNYVGSANAWAGSNLYTTSNQTNFMGVNTIVMRIKRFQVVESASAITFERRKIQDELALCQRYYEKTFAQGTAVAQNAGVTNALQCRLQAVNATAENYWKYRVTKRAAPTVTTYNPSVANANWRDTTAGSDHTLLLDPNSSGGDHGVFITASVGGAQYDQCLIHATANARLS